MSNSISILLRRDLDAFDENDPARRRAVIDEIFIEDCVFCDPNNGIYRGRDEIDRIAGVIKATRLTSSTSQSPSPMSRAMAGGSDGYRAVQARLRLTLELTSSLPGRAA
jgi:hypothetical protein